MARRARRPAIISMVGSQRSSSRLSATWSPAAMAFSSVAVGGVGDGMSVNNAPRGTKTSMLGMGPNQKRPRSHDGGRRGGLPRATFHAFTVTHYLGVRGGKNLPAHQNIPANPQSDNSRRKISLRKAHLKGGRRHTQSC